MIRIANGTLVSARPGAPSEEVRRADLWVQDHRILHVGDAPPAGVGEPVQTVDATGCFVIPGFVQTHVHLCQTLFRNLAENLQLLDWLRRKIWPMEAAHDRSTLSASARLGIAELLTGGTTALLDMGTVHHHDAVFEAARASGIRYTGGKAMMDAGEGVPDGLRETTRDSLRESLDLISGFHDQEGGRLRFAFAPRFVLSCSLHLMEEVRDLSRDRGLVVHTHASENAGEVEAVRQALGRENIDWFHHVGMGSPRLCLAHCVWVTEREMDLMAASGTHALHCPSSNLKLASGIAPVVEMRRRGVSVSLGADGAPCNNRLDMFAEMRLAAMLAKLKHGPAALSAREVFEMATLGGARALGLEDRLGTLAPGKLADLAVIDAASLHCVPWEDPFTVLVYSAQTSDVRDVMVDGRWVVRNRALLTMDEAAVVAQANAAWEALRGRL